MIKFMCKKNFGRQKLKRKELKSLLKIFRKKLKELGCKMKDWSLREKSSNPKRDSFLRKSKRESDLSKTTTKTALK